MNENEINVGKYKFCEFNEQEYSISFNVKGRYEYLMNEKDKDEIENFISYMGKWEEMLIPLIGITNDLEISSIDKPIEEFIIGNYEIASDFYKPSFRNNGYFICKIYLKNLSIMTPSMETFLTHLENAKKWKLLVDTISSLSSGTF